MKNLDKARTISPYLWSKTDQVEAQILIKKGGFVGYMKSVGKLGGQNKVPRLANNRVIAEKLMSYKIKL